MRSTATGAKPDPLTIGDGELGSRLLLGTGGFRSLDALASAIEASATELVTVALRRVDRPSAARSSTCSTAPASRCCPTRPAASPPATRS